MEKASGKNSWRDVICGNVLMMGLVSFFNDASSEMIYPLLPVFISGLVPAASAAIYVGLMEGIAESVSSFLKIFSGRWSDTLRKRKSIAVIGYAFSTLSRPVMALSTAGWHVIALRFFDRVGKGVRTSPRDALISDSIDCCMHARAFSFHRAMDHAGAVVGSIISILILYAFLGYGIWKGSTENPLPSEMHALRMVFLISFIPGIISLIVLNMKVREIVPKIENPPASNAAGLNLPYKFPRRFFFFIAIVTLFALGNSSDLFLIFYGKTRFEVGLLSVVGFWVLLHISKIIFSFPGGYLSDRFGRKNLLVAGWLLYAFVYIMMAFVSSQILFWILLFIYGAFYGLTEGAEKALVAEYSPSEHRGKAYGYYHGAIGFASLPASLLFGVFWAKLGPTIAFSIGASLAAIAAVLLIALLLSEKGQSPKRK